MQKSRLKDYTGQKIHMLTYIRPTDQRSGPLIVWEARCDCGNPTYKVPVRRIYNCGCADINFCTYCQLEKATSDMRSLHQCIECHKKIESVWKKTYYIENIEQFAARRKTRKKANKTYSLGYLLPADVNLQAKRKFARLQGVAKRRELEVALLPEEYQSLIEKECYYCDGFFDIDLGWGTQLDRLDNSKGYVSGNCVRCCNFCNSIKKDTLTPVETKAVINLLIQMRKT